MLTESERRAAKLAVSRYGADLARVQRAFHQVEQAQASGEKANLLDALVREKLLTPTQAQELRQALDSTHFDFNKPAPKAVPAPHPPLPPAEGRVGGGSRPNGDSSANSPRTLAGYRILRKLGEGGMGSVYLAYHEQDDLKVAVKVLSESLAAGPAYVDRFHREARSGSLLSHPNIVRNLSAGEDPASGRHYLVMEYVDGPSAHELLEAHGRLSVGDAVHIALEIARALEHAHSRNVIHRDIKPDNILITRTGVAKLADLGLAKRTDEASHLTAARQGFGTPYYMPYEQAMNAKYADGRSDIYALGATLYHLLTGEVPFAGTNHVEIVEKKNLGFFAPAGGLNPEVPAVLDAILEKMMGREPHERYQTASELIVELERSGLAAPVPSFVDPDLALQDPVVRQRLTSPAEPTCLDVNLSGKEGPAPALAAPPNVWFLRYRDDKGRWCKTKATTEQVLRRLRDRRLPPDVEASHDFQEGFQPLRKFVEFRAAVPPRRRRPPGKAAPAPPGPATAATATLPRWWFWVGGSLALSVLALVVFVLCKVLLSA